MFSLGLLSLALLPSQSLNTQNRIEAFLIQLSLFHGSLRLGDGEFCLCKLLPLSSLMQGLVEILKFFHSKPLIWNPQNFDPYFPKVTSFGLQVQYCADQ